MQLYSDGVETKCVEMGQWRGQCVFCQVISEQRPTPPTWTSPHLLPPEKQFASQSPESWETIQTRVLKMSFEKVYFVKLMSCLIRFWGWEGMIFPGKQVKQKQQVINLLKKLSTDKWTFSSQCTKDRTTTNIPWFIGVWYLKKNIVLLFYYAPQGPIFVHNSAYLSFQSALKIYSYTRNQQSSTTLPRVHQGVHGHRQSKERKQSRASSNE